MTARPYLIYLQKWLVLSLAMGLITGSASAIFLLSLEQVTQFREQRPWLYLGLPLGGFLVGWLYYRYGREAEAGNRLVFSSIQHPEQQIPIRMAPLVYLGTLITHLFGGSAGREGTALQMAAALSYPLKKWVNKDELPVVLLAAVAGGFGSVFGTPLAGAVFAMEVSKKRSALPAFATALIANQVTQLWQVQHTHYAVDRIPELHVQHLFSAGLAGLAFGLCAAVFLHSYAYSSSFIKKHIHYPPLRPLMGGLILVILYTLIDAPRYMGLGIPTLLESFSEASPPAYFALKLGLTVLTLSAGFKGGEVTPLFFIGATLGSFLSTLVPLPLGLLAAMGFVSVFGAAAKTPVACVLLGMELFGYESLPFIATACAVAYFCSGKKNIYK